MIGGTYSLSPCAELAQRYDERGVRISSLATENQALRTLLAETLEPLALGVTATEPLWQRLIAALALPEHGPS